MDNTKTASEPSQYNPPQKSSRLFIISGFIMMLVIGVAIGYYFGSTRSSNIKSEIKGNEQSEMKSPSPTSAVITQAVNSDYTRFESVPLGLSLQYPPNMYFKDYIDSIGIYFEPLPTEETLMFPDGITLNKRDQTFKEEFDALFNAEVGEDVPEAHNAVYVKIEKLRNFKIDGYDAVEYFKDGITPIPTNPEFGRGPIGYSSTILIKKNENEYYQITNSSMNNDLLNERAGVFLGIIESLDIK